MPARFVSERSDARRPERRAAGVVRHEQIGRGKYLAGAPGDEFHRDGRNRREADRGADAAEPERAFGRMLRQRRRCWRRIGGGAMAGFDGCGGVGGSVMLMVLDLLRRLGRRQHRGRRRADRQSRQRQRHHQRQYRPEQSHPAFSSPRASISSIAPRWSRDLSHVKIKAVFGFAGFRSTRLRTYTPAGYLMARWTAPHCDCQNNESLSSRFRENSPNVDRVRTIFPSTPVQASKFVATRHFCARCVVFILRALWRAVLAGSR